MLTAAEIITEAVNRAKVPGYSATFGLRNLNAALSDICQHYDYALARGIYNFSFNPALASLFGSGPYSLPLDYLRTSGSSGATGAAGSVFYLYPAPEYPYGQTIPMLPIDLAQFDQFPQLDGQSTPGLWATDMGGPLTQRIVLSTTMDLVANSTVATPADLTNLRAGLSVAGEGITPGTTVLSVGATTVVLSDAPLLTLAAASVFFGIAPVGYAFPPPLGPYPVTIRYQRQMPPITDPLTVPWFPDEGYLITETAARLCEISDDARALNLHAMAGERMRKYAQKADDKTNRAQSIQLDPRTFGGGSAYGRAKNTKYAGW